MIVLKVICNVCLFYAILSVGSSWSSRLPLMLVTAAFCGLAIGLAAYGKQKSGKVLSLLAVVISLVPLIGCLYSGERSIWIIVGLFLPAFYTDILIGMGNLTVELWSFEVHFKWSAIAGAFYWIMIRLGGGAWKLSLLFLISYYMLGSFLLRQVRLGEQADAKSKLIDLGVMLVVGVLGVVAARLLVYVGKFVPALLSVVMLPFLGIVYVIGWILQFLLDIFGMPEFAMPELTLNLAFEAAEQEAEAAAVSPVGVWLKLFLGIVILLAAIVIVVLLIRRFRRNQANQETVDGHTSHTRLAPVLKDPGPKDSSRRRQLRRVYRRYMLFLRKNGMDADETFTSLDVKRQGENLEFYRHPADREEFKERHHKLRSLYLKARYRVGQEVTKEEVSLAARLEKEIENDK